MSDDDDDARVHAAYEECLKKMHDAYMQMADSIDEIFASRSVEHWRDDIQTEVMYCTDEMKASINECQQKLRKTNK